MRNEDLGSLTKAERKQEKTARRLEREEKIKAKIQTKRDEHCIWHFLDGSDSSCSLKPLDKDMKKKTGNTHERTECYGSPTACRYKALHTPQGEYNTEPMEIVAWMTKHRRPEWFPLLQRICYAGARKVYLRMTKTYYSLEVFIELPRDPNKQIRVMMEIVNMQPDLCTSTMNQTEDHKASIRLLFKSPDEKRSPD